MDSTAAATKDEFFGVIAIDEKCDGYVSMHKKGEETGGRTVFSELDYKNRLTPKTKEKQEHIKKLVSLIKKEGTFMHDGTSVIMQELVVAACDDYGDDLEKLAKFSHTKPQFVKLPPYSKDPIADALQAREKKSTTAPWQTYHSSTSQPDLAKEDDSVREVAKKRTEKVRKESTPPATSSTHSPGTPQGSLVKASQNMLEGASETGPGKQKYSTRQDTAIINSSRTAQDSISQDSADSDTSVSAGASNKGLTDGNEMLTTIMGAIEEMKGKINEIDAKLEIVINSQERSSSAKGRAPQAPAVALRFSPSPEPNPSLLYNLHHAPSKVYKIEQQFVDRLEKKLSYDKKQLQEDVSGPSVVFAINSSRIQADIQRDLKSVTFTGPTLLMIIKPTREPERTPPRLLSDDLAGFPVEGRDCHYLLVDNNNTALHDCDVNSETVDSVARFIAKNQSVKK